MYVTYDKLDDLDTIGLSMTLLTLSRCVSLFSTLELRDMI